MSTFSTDCGWLNNAADHSDVIRCYPLQGLQVDLVTSVVEMVTASGRVITARDDSAGVRRQVRPSIGPLPRGTGLRVAGLTGKVVYWRDLSGRAMWALMRSAPLSEVGSGTGLVTVTPDLLEVSEP